MQEEEALDPLLPIIDPHLHLWEILPAPGAPQEPQRFLLHELLQTIETSGHNVTHSVFVECHQMYRCDGPPELASLGETEVANGCAAMSASGKYGPRRIAHRIVAGMDLSIGARVGGVLDAHKAAAGERFVGVRPNVAYSKANMFGFLTDPRLAHAMTRSDFIDGARELAKRNLSLDIWCLHTQLAELIALADAVPDLSIILDHVGTPECAGIYANREAEARAEWATLIADLARRSNVRVKLGGMGMDISTTISAKGGSQSSETLAAKWRPYIETCIQAFTPQRCMFESNFPPDKQAGTYGATWNAFKRIARNFSETDKDLLFRRTAANTYRITLD